MPILQEPVILTSSSGSINREMPTTSDLAVEEEEALARGAREGLNENFLAKFLPLRA